MKKRIFSLALALALSAAFAASQTTLAKRAHRSQAGGAATSGAHAADTPANSSSDSADEGDQPQKPKPKGNGFARALGAPFRALARLFGGGKKSTTEEAKKRKANTPQTAASAGVSPAVPAVEAPKQTPEPVAAASVNAAPAQSKRKVTPAALKADKNRLKTRARDVDVTSGASVASAPEVNSNELAPAAAATRPAEGARVVRPDARGAIVEPPKMWIPVIEGIAKDPLTQGRALLEHGYVQEAISNLNVAATQVGPGLVEANNLLGIAYDRVGWHKQAAEAYNRALTVAPKDPVVIANLGYSLYLSDDYAGALKRLKQAAKLAPGTPVIYNNLGVVTARVGKYDEAYKYFAIASNDYDAHLKLASILEDHGRDRDAVKHYEAALAMQPGASAVLERLVALYERTGERDKADTARRALGQPKNPQKTTTGGGGGGD
ncbi:MAG TPA: tetratricopeptide repeat protein [Pyrinomonadaceae bacterium]|nr:tetratricopeptide repeat protein [Pyrinomonadaceae bacterium]